MTKISISPRRWLLVPIETKSRELHAKVLLSCVAAERGWGVILGEMDAIRDQQELLPRGVLIEKSIHPGTEKLIEKSLACGNRVSAWCEEGLIYHGQDDYHERRLKLESFDVIDLFFAWGSNQAQDICSALNRPMDKIVLSGNPRFDLLKPELRNIFLKGAIQIHLKYGPIILVNTKFSFVNLNIKGVDRIALMKSRGLIKTKEEESLMYRALELQKKLFSSFIHLIPALSENFPEHTIIIRPHPSESHVPWLELAKDLPNVEVVFEGTANEWIMASDVMIHNNCTTGVEAFMLGKPAISYRPVKDEVVEHPLPDRVSYSVSTETELINCISNLLYEKDIQADLEIRRSFASKYILNIDGKLASDIIMENLDKLELDLTEACFPVRSACYDYKSLKKLLINFIKPDRYALQKFPGLELDELNEIFNTFRQVTGRFDNVKIIPADNHNCYCLFKP